MKKSLEKLWEEYFWDECSTIKTDEERLLLRRVAELRETVNALLDQDQQLAVEKYVEAVYDLEALLMKNAFFKGCAFARSFILESDA